MKEMFLLYILNHDGDCFDTSSGYRYHIRCDECPMNKECYAHQKVDGKLFSREESYAKAKQMFIESFGIMILRINSADINSNINEVIEIISRFSKPPPAPPLKGGEWNTCSISSHQLISINP